MTNFLQLGPTSIVPPPPNSISGKMVTDIAKGVLY
jgi:hypothetical protein